MLRSVGILLLLLVLSTWESDCVQLSNTNDYQHTIYVDPSSPNSVDNATCYTNSKQYPCHDINFALAFPERQSSTVFYLSSNSTHHLTNNATNNLFAESSLLAFVGDGGTASVECGYEAGLAFINSTNISISGVRFLYCGAWRDSTSAKLTSKTLELMSIRVGLYFYNCRNVNMSHMSVSNSTEAVGVVMYSVAGKNYIGHSNFDHNRIDKSNKNDSGGGGFAIEFNYCKPGDNSCGEHNHQTQNNNGSVHHFEYCSFSYNRGMDQSGKNGRDISILPRNETHLSLGRGGGFSLYFKGKAMKNNVSFLECDFVKNQATWGAGMIIELVDSAIENHVSVISSRFIYNNCYNEDRSKGGPGGGIRMASFVYFPMKPDKTLKRNTIAVKWGTFDKNQAIFGGAISISFHRQPNSHLSQLPQANISGSLFQFNSARLGSAVSVDRDHYFTSGNLGTTYFRGCVYNNNTIVYVDPRKPHSVGIGALYVSEIAVVFEDYNIFGRNNGTAVAIVGTTLTFSHYATATFEENRGSDGGALALLGMASIIMGGNTSVNFTNNYASLYGGAIYNSYIGREDLSSSVKCFLQYYDPFCPPTHWLTYFEFTGNRAGKLGQSIFSTTILPCSWSEGNEIASDVAKNVFCWNNVTWVYVNSSCDEEIRTLPRHFDLSHVKHHIFPGHNFQLNIMARDDLDHNVTMDTIYTAVVTNNLTAKVDPKFSFIADNYVGIMGKEEQTVTLELNTARERDWGFHINLTIDKCPPGFTATAPLYNETEYGSVSYDVSKTVCECIRGKDIYSFAGNLLCDKSGLVSKIRNGYWVGIVPSIDNDTLYVGTTNLLYRHSSEDFFPIDTSYERLDYNQCLFLNRAGPLCGECREGFSTAVNSFDYKCVLCNRNDNETNFVGNVFTYLALSYLPYVFVFIAVTYFDIRVMSGPLVGFILYAQMIGSGVVDLTVNSVPYIDTENVPRTIQRAYRIAYGFFNLNSLSEVINPFCVRENFTALDAISLDYGVALFPLLPIFTVFFMVRFSNFKCCTKRRGIRNVRGALARANVDQVPQRSLLHPLVTFIYLSYTKFTLTSAKLLSTTRVLDKDGNAQSDRYPIYYAGQYYFGQKEYMLPYGLVAISLFIIFALLFPLVFLGPIDLINWLLDKPRFEKLKRFWPTLTVNNFMDAFHGCYKPKQKYFTGLYLVFRSATFLVYAFSSNEISIRSWQLIFLFMLAIAVAYKKPYQVDLYNYLDLAFLFNLALINFISIYMYTSHAGNAHTSDRILFYSVGVILVWLPMMYFVLYISYLFLHRTTIYKNNARRLKALTVRLKNHWRRFCGEPTVEEQRPLLNPATRGIMCSSEISDSGLTDNDLFHRASESSRANNQQRGNKSKKATRTVIVADRMEGMADVYSTNVTGSSGIATGESGSSRSSNELSS